MQVVLYYWKKMLYDCILVEHSSIATITVSLSPPVHGSNHRHTWQIVIHVYIIHVLGSTHGQCIKPSNA